MSQRSSSLPQGTGVPRAPRRVSEDTGGTGDGIQVISYVITGLLVYGGLGWLADWFFDTAFWFPIGLVVGAGLAMYLIIKRFGRTTARSADTRTTNARKE